MPKTEFEPYGTVVTSAFCQKIFGGSQDKTLAENDPLRSGHKHDGKDEDGHCAKIGADEISEDASDVFVEKVRSKVSFIGEVKMYAGWIGSKVDSADWYGVDLPDGYLLCDGNTVPSDTKYNKFREWIFKYAKHLIHEDGSYHTPDISGRVPIGVGIGNDGKNEEEKFYNGNVGGEYKHKLEIEEMPNHNHGVNSVCSSQGKGNDTDVNFKGFGSVEFQSNGDDKPHENMPPYFAINFIIRAVE